MKINRVKIYGGLQHRSSQPKGFTSGCNTIRTHWSIIKIDAVKGFNKRRKIN